MSLGEAVEGWLDYGSGRYKLVGRAGLGDCYLHNGDGVEVYYRGQWLRVWAFSNGERWRFQERRGDVVAADLLGLPARR